MNWKLFEAKVFNILAKVAENVMQGYNEKWVGAKTLAEHIETFTPRWLEDHGKALPRTQVIYKDANGKEHAGNWLYPLHEIQRMMKTGEIKNLLDV